MTDVHQHKVAQFNAKHDVSEAQQFHALVEEVGELSEAYNTQESDEDVAEELADVIFVARSLAEVRDIDITEHVNAVTAENLDKDESTDGEKVTKSMICEANPRDGDSSESTKKRSDGQPGISHTTYGVTD
jgi:NTP pyrophosphatase (non-canonical NTP hydrolase)